MLLQLNNLGLHALQLLHAEPDIKEALRLQTMAALMQMPDIRHKRPLCSPFHAIFSHSHIDPANPATMLGMFHLAPLCMHLLSLLLKRSLS